MELSQVLEALRNADAAGDTEAASRLASIAQQLSSGAPAPTPAPVPAAKPAPFSFKDTGLSLLEGATGAAQGIAASFGADNAVAKELSNVQKHFGSLKSPERQAEIQRRAQLEEEAARSGSKSKEAATFLGGIAEAPVQTLFQGVGSAIPAALAGLATAVAGAPAAIAGAVAIGARLLTGAIQGAGETKGSIYETVEQELVAQGVPKEQARQQAIAAQDYLGKNMGNIFAGAGLGAVAGGFGAEASLARPFAKKAAKEAVESGMGKFARRTGLSEALPEGAQGGQERYATNVALQREGVETPEFQGVLGSALRDAAAGAITGAGANAITGGKRPPAPDQQPVAGPRSAKTVEEEFAGEEPAPKAAPEPAQQAALPAPEERAALPAPADEDRDYAALAQERERLKPYRSEPEVAARIKEITDILRARDAQGVEEARMAKESVFSEEELPEVRTRESVVSPEVFKPQDILDTGVKLDSSAKWFADNVVGKTKEEVQALVDAKPHLAKGNRPQARILRSLLAPTVPAFEEAQSDQTTEEPTTEPKLKPRGSKPSLGVPSGTTDTGDLGAGVQPAAEPAEPVGRGLVPTEQPVSEGRAPEVPQPSALNEPAPTEEPATPPSEPVAETTPAAAPEAPAPVAPAPAVAPTQFPIKTQLTQAAEDMALPEATRKEAAGLAEILTSGAGPQRAAKKFLEHVGKIRAANARREAVAKGTAPIETETDAEVEARRKEAADMEARLKARAKEEMEERKRQQAEANKASEELRAARAEAEKAKAEADKAKAEAEKAKAEAKRAKKAEAEQDAEMDTADRAFKLVQRDDAKIEPRHVKYVDKLIREKNYAEANRVMDIIERRIAEKRYSQTESEGRALPQEIIDMLRSDNLTGAMELMAKQGETPLTRALAERLKTLLTKTDVQVLDNLVNDRGERVRGAARSDGKKIWLDTDTGLDEETLMHEAVHAASERVINMPPSARTDAQRAAIAELNQIWNAAKNDKTINLSEEARASLSEFVTEAMTNYDLQKALAVKPWKKATAWEKFKTNLLKMIGVADPESMLDTTIAAMDTIFTTPAPGKGPVKILSHATKNGQAILASLGITNPQQMYGTKALYKGMANSADVSAIDKVRTKVADSAASIEKRIMNYFNGAVRNSLGELNPMGLYRQAQDYSKMLLAFYKAGSIEKDTTTGLWMVKDKGTTPPAKVLELVKQFAEKNGTSFEEAMQITGRALEAFRMENLLKQDPQFPNHLTAQELSDGLALYNSDAIFAEMNKAMDASRKELVDHMVAVGRLSADEGKDWKDVIGYVPFDRIEDFAENYRKTKKPGSRSPLSVSQLPKLIGSNVRPVGNVFENYLNTLGWMVGQVMNTDARNQTLSFLESISQAKYLGADTQGRPNVAYGYKDGGLVYWELPSEYDVLAFKFDEQASGPFLKQFSAASNILRTTVTALPPFALKQVIDDIQRALLTSGVQNPLSLIGMVLTNFPKIALAEIRGVRHRIVEDAEALGLSGEYDFKQGKPGATFMEDMGYVPRGKFRTLMHKLDGITRASDLAVRKAIYDQTIKETKGDVLLAQTRAREFINFRRRGSSGTVGYLVKTVPFFNAYIQGMDVLYRAASGIDSSASVDRAQARKMFWSRAAIAISLSTAYAMSKADDDEEYNEADLRTRDSNWFIGGYKLSVPGELGAIFKVIPERVVEYYKRKGTPEEQEAMEAVRTAMSYMFEQYVGRVTPIPQAAKPLLEAWTNYSFLTGRELIGIHQKQLDPSMQRRENTSELALAIAEFSKNVVGVDKISPIIVDNVLRGYFGSTAALTVMATDGLLNPTRVDRPLHRYALLSNYMIDPVGTRRISEFYDERDRVGRANTTLNELVKAGRLDEAEAYMDKHEQELMLNSNINATLEQLEQTRAYRKYLNGPDAAADMSMEERVQELEEVKKMEIEFTSWLREAKTLIRQGN